MPTYNPDQYLYNSVSSIIKQYFRDWRLILIDDGSTSSYKKLIKEISDLDPRIELITLNKNQGGGFARNIGLKKITASYVAFCDSDDMWPPEKLKSHIELMESKHNINITHCNMLRLDNNHEYMIIVPEKIDIDEFLLGTQLYCSSVVLRASIIKNAKFGEMKARHPFRFWCTILAKGEISHNVSGNHFKYLVRPKSVSSNKIKMIYYTTLAYLLYAPSKRKALKGVFFRAKRFITHKQ